MERVNKGEEYWFIDKDGEILWRYESYSCQDDMMFNYNNYFHTREEAEAMAEKIRKVFKGAWVLTPPEGEILSRKVEAILNGADVIEMPSEVEVSIECDYSAHKMDIDDGETPNSGLYWRGWGDAIRWLKSKIVK